MRTLILQGSPRKEGNTATLVRQFVKGLRDGGSDDVREFVLNDMNIRPCQGCLTCVTSCQHECIIEDDMQQIYREFIASNTIVFATPVYWWHMSAQLKTCMDRMDSLAAGGHFRNKNMVLITTYGFEDPDGVDLMVKMFGAIAKWANMRISVLRYCSGPPREGKHVSSVKEKLDEAYKLGRSFAGGMDI